jgi:hypothetical protein
MAHMHSVSWHGSSRPRLGLAIATLSLAAACASAGPGSVVHVDIRVPIASSANVGGPCDASSFGSHTNGGTRLSTIPGGKFTLGAPPNRILGETSIPTMGTIGTRGGDDPEFRTDCSFKFDVSSDPTVQTYVVNVAKIYIPLPVASHDQLAAAGWTAVISINVDQ